MVDGAERCLQELVNTAVQRHSLRFLFRNPNVTYGAFGIAVERIADWLWAKGFRHGDRFAIVGRNCWEGLAAACAAARLGGAFVFLSGETRPTALHGLIQDCDPLGMMIDVGAMDCLPNLRDFDGPLLVGGRDGRYKIPASDARCPTEVAITSVDILGLFYTSGSTGQPLGVVFSHDNALFVSAAIHERLRYRESDIIGVFISNAFDYSFYQFILALRSGAAIYVGDQREIGPAFVNVMTSAGITVFPGTPTLIAILIRMAQRRSSTAVTSSLRMITSTGEQLPVERIHRLRQLFPSVDLYPMYGLTECKRVSILTPNEIDLKQATVGKPLSDTEVFAVDESGSRLAPGTAGELVVRGRHVALGYWRNREATLNAFHRGDPWAARTLHTGDLGHVDTDGFVTVKGRIDAVVKRRGFKVSCEQVECEVQSVDGVVDASLVLAEEQLHLFVVYEGTLSRPDLLRAIRSCLDPSQRPEHLHVVGTFPRTINGKVDRKELKSTAIRLMLPSSCQ